MKKFLIVVIVGFVAVSCEDFLEKEPLDSVAPDAFFQTEEQTEIALNGMYDRFNNESWYRRAIWNFTILGTDLGTFRARGNAAFANFDTYTVDPANRWIEGLMAQAYLAINAANTVINRVERSGLSEAFIATAIAEARFIRALVYFDLVRVYGGVHVTIDETITPETDPALFSRNSAAEVYDQIVSDLTSARDNLPDVPRTIGTPTSWAAQALLGKVMMQRAGTLADSDAATLWNNAATELQGVITNGPFDLLQDYGDIFDIQNEGSMEHVFAIKFSRQVSGGHMGFRFLGPRGRDVVPGNGFHTILVDTVFYARYAMEDQRRLVTARQDTTINGTFIEYRDGLAINKYLDPEPLD
ncbi:MAG: RagB/SusD family nutrient uptake outer membrane protein, partial [Bacteroidota bacterium]